MDYKSVVFIILYLSSSSRDVVTSAYSVDIETSTPAEEKSITDIFSEDFISCPKFSLEPDEYALYDNGTVYIAAYGQWYNPSNYYLNNETLYVCFPFYSMSESTSDALSSNGSGLQKNFSREFLQCVKNGLDPYTYKIKEDKSAYVIIYNKTYSPSDYLLRNRTLYVCLPTGHTINFAISGMSDIPLVYLTYVGLGISITCLVLHLLVFVIVPFVKTLSGFCLASLSTALLMAYISFLSMPSNENYFCAAVGRSTYYFFMASFFWMNTISLDIFKSFYFAANNISSASKWSTFSFYSVYSWFTPTVFVALAVIADNSDSFPEEFRPKFGAETCWFGEKKSLIAFFVIPLLVIMIVNLACFLSSMMFIQRATAKSTLSSHVALRQNFVMFMKLMTVMGLSWIFGIIAGSTNIEALWYIFVILNTLQGMFIFLSFSLTKKIRKYFRKKVFPRRNSFDITVGTF